jgi:hypothetical protein
LIAGYQAITPDTASLQHISGNAALSLRVNGSDINLKGKLRIKRNEGIQITITPLGLIEAASIEFLPQKVRLINKLTKKYTEVPYSEASAIGLAGINSGGMNLIYERVPKEMRVCALAFKNTLAGIVSFITTLFASQLVKRIQENGNKFFGMDLYAQQVMSAITTVGIIVLIIYLNTVVKKMNINKDSD